jgi:hypothetical protein
MAGQDQHRARATTGVQNDLATESGRQVAAPETCSHAAHDRLGRPEFDLSEENGTSSDGESLSMNGLIESYRHPRRPTFRRSKANFQDYHRVIIVEEYFARFVHAGVLLSRDAKKRFLRRSRYAISLAYDSSEAESSIDEMLRAVRREERQSAILLTGRAHQILIQTAYSLIVYLLNTIDCSDAQRLDGSRAVHVNAAVASAKRDLRRMEQFTRSAAKRSALWHYLIGLPLGLVVGVGLVVAVFESDTVDRLADPRLVASCLASGAVGAVISVMVRVNRGTTLEVDYDRGRAVTLLAGGFRPIIGAVFGGALYVLVQGGLLPLQIPSTGNLALSIAERSSFFFIGLSFLAGFSERWAQDTIVSSAPKSPATSRREMPDNERAGALETNDDLTADSRQF